MEQREAAAKRAEMLEKMRTATDFNAFSRALYEYICMRLSLPAGTKERDLYRLVVYSVKLRMKDVDTERLEERLATVDCHQTSYVVSRKNLMMMEIEKGIGVRMPAEMLDDVRTADDYAHALWRVKQNEA